MNDAVSAESIAKEAARELYNQLFVAYPPKWQDLETLEKAFQSAISRAVEEAKQDKAFTKDAQAAELPRIVACAVIIKEGKVLLERRAPTGVDGLDDAWDLPGGKVESGETVMQAAEREIKEELGITVRACPTQRD